MFNSFFKDFEDFAEHCCVNNENVRQMMRSFSEPFGNSSMSCNPVEQNRECEETEHVCTCPVPKNEPKDMSRSLLPFGNTETCHSFSSSAVMTYSKAGNEPPKVYQSCSSTHCGPGGIRETRQSVKDSETGEEKMCIGHYIQDRGRIIEKRFNAKTGQNECCQDFHNMDESDAQCFDEEWQREVSKFEPNGMCCLRDPPC